MLRKYTAKLALPAALIIAAPVLAQDPLIEEIVVTATKRPQTLQEVPIAVSVVDSDTMERAQVLDIQDLQGLVPSLRVTQLQTSGNTNFLIRGFGNGANNPGIEPSVGVFIDGVYRSRSAAALTDLPNLERVEVLRGPQSTLFGKNASAGVISVTTAAPSLDAYNGSATLTYGNYDQVIAKADINGPLSDTFSWGLSGSYNTRDGYFTNLVNSATLNERNRWGLRGQLYWEPSDVLSFRFIADYDEIDEKCCGVANLVDGPTGVAVRLVGGQLVPNDAFAYEQYYDFDPTNKITNNGSSLQIDWDIADAATLTSITAYREQERFENADVDFTSAALISQNTGDTEIKTFTQELRLAGSNDALDWMIGGYYFDEEVRYDNVISYGDTFRAYADILSTIAAGGIPGIDPSPLDDLEDELGLQPGTYFERGTGAAEFTGQDDKTFSAFGQLDWHVTDRVTLTGGLNYTTVDKDARVSQDNTDAFAQTSLVQVGGGLIFQQVFELVYAQAYAAAIAQGATPEQADAIATATATPAATQAAAAGAPTDCGDVPAGTPCNPLLPLQALQFLPPVLNYPNSVEPGTSSESKTTWTARIAFDATDEINIYASAGTGFKASSWNLSRDSRPFEADIPALLQAGLGVPNLTPGTRYAGPEESLVYELGMKANWDRIRLNAAIFHQEIDGFQSNIFIGTGFELRNAGKQSTDGLELDFLWFPIDDLQFSFSGTWLDPVYDSFPEGPGVGGITDLTGQKPAGIHEFSMNTAVNWDFQLGATMDGYIRVEYIYEDEVQVVDNVPAEIASREVSVLNASLGLVLNQTWDLMLWGRNLTDDQYLQSAFPSVAQAGSFSGYPNQPQTYGITLRANFN